MFELDARVLFTVILSQGVPTARIERPERRNKPPSIEPE
jgi:hypothetical protein